MEIKKQLPVTNNICCGCTACASICPKKAIIMHEDEEGFLSPILDEKVCIDCGLCKRVCPVLNPVKNKSPETVWAAWGRNEVDRKTSSSGAISSILARYIIKNGGVVFGAVMDNFYVYHDMIDSTHDLYRMQGSKYVQSDMGDCFTKARTMLELGRQVMFTGTPCQIAGLRNFLQKDYDNLLCVDVICHGVPSPGVLRRYVEELKQEYYTATSLTFRDKVEGWNPVHAFALYDDEGKRLFREAGRFNVYLTGFLKNVFDRQSCGQCRFTSVERPGDITLGDYWRIAQYSPALSDKKGTSLCILNTEKGREVFQAIQNELAVSQECPLSIAVAAQAQLRGPAPVSKLRKEFFEAFRSHVRIEEFLNRKLFHVGIMNFHFANNFGAVLVPYALMQVVRSLGYLPEIINYMGSHPVSSKPFEEFRQKYLVPSSNSLEGREDLRKISPWWKTIIVGSDQIWRMFDTGIYMLNWAAGRKNLISYAASFGHDRYAGRISEEEARVLLSRFDSISVREKSGVDICKNFGVKALQVLDPTLLLPAENYSKLIEENGGLDINQPYVCIVLLKSENLNFIHENKALTEFKNYNILDAIREKTGVFRTVYKWLDAIRRAEFVITDSFHGTVFSIIFKKQFVCIMPKNFNGQARIPSLLNTLHIKNSRIYDSIMKITPSSFDEKIDYDNVYKYLEKEKIKSMLFLKCALEKNISEKGKYYNII